MTDIITSTILAHGGKSLTASYTMTEHCFSSDTESNVSVESSRKRKFVKSKKTTYTRITSDESFHRQNTTLKLKRGVETGDSAQNSPVQRFAANFFFCIHAKCAKMFDLMVRNRQVMNPYKITISGPIHTYTLKKKAIVMIPVSIVILPEAQRYVIDRKSSTLTIKFWS